MTVLIHTNIWIYQDIDRLPPLKRGGFLALTLETTSAGYNLPHFLNKVKILLLTETLVPFYIPKLKHWVLNPTFDNK